MLRESNGSSFVLMRVAPTPHPRLSESLTRQSVERASNFLGYAPRG